VDAELHRDRPRKRAAEAIKDLPLANKPRTLAEARLLRAYFYYNLMDLFGGCPS
jgi:hypothetical protein